MSLIGAMAASASALAAERVRIELIAENLAHVHTTRTPAGEPYRRKMVAFADASDRFAGLLARFVHGAQPEGHRGVVPLGVYVDPRPFQRVYEPGHPDADAEGFVQLPNVDVAEEMINLIAATRAYEANVTAFNVSKTLVQSALTIGQ